MNVASRWLVVVLVLALALLAGWRVVATGMADLYADDEPERALAWDAHHPAALIARADRQLAEQQPHAAAATVRALLRREPLQAQAFRVLGAAADAEGDTARARMLYTLAVRHAPRDPRGRAWIIDDLLRDGHYAEAIEHIDIVLRTSPGQAGGLFPIMIQLADAPAFADALAHSLSANPDWRAGLLETLFAQASDAAVDQVHAALQDNGGLSVEEGGRLSNRLMAEGRWGEAYSRWASGLDLAPGASLPLVYNGGFETEPSGTGFDWRIARTPGVLVERIADVGATGSFAIKLAFLGRRVPQINLEQRLLLAPGSYQLSFRARADALRSDKGLQWAIACHGDNQTLLLGPTVEGSFAWKSFDTPFTVPEEDCPVQNLWLHNPGTAAAGKTISGDLWLDDIKITNTQRHRG